MLTVAEYETYDAMGLAGLVATKQTSVSEVLETAISHVEAKNPVLNAVVHKMYDATRLTISRALPVGPLAGVPFLIKDVGSYCKGARCGNGSRLFDGFIAEHDDTAIERYKAAGLVIIGRTNSSEFALAPATEPVANGPTLRTRGTTREAPVAQAAAPQRPWLLAWCRQLTR
jgi:Asp-tRNA(Asn)/Glu-tRNA(Gln) amidotransferase A subunit family amidase